MQLKWKVTATSGMFLNLTREFGLSNPAQGFLVLFLLWSQEWAGRIVERSPHLGGEGLAGTSCAESIRKVSCQELPNPSLNLPFALSSFFFSLPSPPFLLLQSPLPSALYHSQLSMHLEPESSMTAIGIL